MKLHDKYRAHGLSVDAVVSSPRTMVHSEMPASDHRAPRSVINPAGLPPFWSVAEKKKEFRVSLNGAGQQQVKGESSKYYIAHIFRSLYRGQDEGKDTRMLIFGGKGQYAFSSTPAKNLGISIVDYLTIVMALFIFTPRKPI